MRREIRDCRAMHSHTGPSKHQLTFPNQKSQHLRPLRLSLPPKRLHWVHSQASRRVSFHLHAPKPCSPHTRKSVQPRASAADAASLDTETSEAVETGRSNSQGHSHAVTGCCDRGNSANASGRASKLLESLLRPTGLLKLADLLGDKVWVTITIAVLFGVAAAASFLPGLSQLAAERVQQTCVGGIFLLAGIPEGVQLLFKLLVGNIDTHVLMTLACFGTLGIGAAMEGALLLVLFQASHTIEHELTEQAQGNLESLVRQVPETATLVELSLSGQPDIQAARKAPVDTVAIGSNTLVMAGEQIPLDGVIVHGEALVSSEHITGEALPVSKGKGDEIPAGAMNHDGLLVIRTTASASQSTPARIASLTRQAQSSKPRIGRWLDTFGGIYARCVIGGVVLSFLGLVLSGVPMMSQGAQRGAIYRSIGLLSTASPCALVLVPLAYISALAAVSNRGILLRESSVLDALNHCTTIAVDKTGTLTTGTMSCIGMLDPMRPESHLDLSGLQSPDLLQEVAETGDLDDLAALAAIIALSERASHPVSKAVSSLAQASSSSVEPAAIDKFQLVSGAGVKAVSSRQGRQREVRFGSVAFSTEALGGRESAAVRDAAAQHGSGRIVSVLVDSEAGSSSPGLEPSIIRLFFFTDTVHPQSRAAIGQLQGNGSQKEVIMLTGDNEAEAKRIGMSLGIGCVEAGLTPQGKLEAISRARSRGLAQSSSQQAGVIMVGDGINDAPALASADVGIALTSVPSEAAAAAADVIFVTRDGISPLPFLLGMAHSTQTIIKQNLVIAMGAMLALSLPTLWGAIPLSLAVGLHEASTLLVALNSLRLLYRKDHLAAA